MDDARYEAIEARIFALESRLAALETRRGMLQPACAKALLDAYPFGMNKKEAAKAIGITRATVYAMLRDGRLMGNGRNYVTTESVVRLLSAKEAAGQAGRSRG